MNDGFTRLHPIVILLYFLLLSVISMIILNPYMLAICFVLTFAYMLASDAKNAVKAAVFMDIPIFFLSVIMNPLFNGKGITILFYSPFGNPVTLEALIYGAASGLMFASVLNIFFIFNRIMTSDKIIFLFGRIMPSLSLIISMILRFVPRIEKKAAELFCVRKCMGENDSTKSARIENASMVMSALTAWTLEGSIETADSMKARGYGVKNRTSFSNYRFGKHDAVFSIFLTAFSVVFLLFSKSIKTTFFPAVKIRNSVTEIICYTAICAMPFILRMKDEIKWRYLKSKI